VAFSSIRKADCHHRPFPTFGSGYAPRQKSARPDLWDGLTCAFAPFLGILTDPTKVVFGAKTVPTFSGGASDRCPNGHAWQMPGVTSSQIVLGKTDDLIGLAECTIALGFHRTHTAASAGGLIGSSSTTSAEEVGIHLPDSNNEFHFLFGTSDFGFSIFPDTDTAFYHHNWVFSAGRLGMFMFCDGQQISSAAAPSARSANGSSNLIVGAGALGSTTDEDAVISFLYVWNRQLPAGVVSLLASDPGALFRLYRIEPRPPPLPAPPPILLSTAAVQGGDIDCITDVGKTLTIATGLRNLGNALARRLMTPRGALHYDPQYGTDVRLYLNAGMTPQQMGQVQGDIASEVSKDERIDSPTVTVAFVGSAMSITVACVTADGPFDFIISVNKLTASLLDVRASS